MSLYSSDRHFLLAQANIIGICIGLLKCQPADMQITNPLIRGSETRCHFELSHEVNINVSVLNQTKSAVLFTLNGR